MIAKLSREREAGPFARQDHDRCFPLSSLIWLDGRGPRGRTDGRTLIQFPSQFWSVRPSVSRPYSADSCILSAVFAFALNLWMRRKVTLIATDAPPAAAQAAAQADAQAAARAYPGPRPCCLECGSTFTFVAAPQVVVCVAYGCCAA